MKAQIAGSSGTVLGPIELDQKFHDGIAQRDWVEKHGGEWVVLGSDGSVTFVKVGDTEHLRRAVEAVQFSPDEAPYVGRVPFSAHMGPGRAYTGLGHCP